jgi:hypothetical protein
MTTGDTGGASRATSGSSGSYGSSGTTGTSETYETESHRSSGSDRPFEVREEILDEPRTREETVVREEREVQHPAPVAQTPVNVEVEAEGHDGVRWGPVWAGLLTALSSFLLLELLFYGLGWLTIDPGATTPGNNAGWVSGILALVAFFLGGLVAGATAMYKGLSSGLLHGFLVWALGVLAILFLTLFGGGALLGSFADLIDKFLNLRQTASVNPAEATTLAETTKDAALPAFFGLALPLAASMLGGLIGSKMWPRNQGTQHDTISVRGDSVR